ncbi:S9 family peptidase, partial [Xanthomonas campestris pv. campestris]|nr:S9 family peptidase [Xanthomonas campestris pv. campestris]
MPTPLPMRHLLTALAVALLPALASAQAPSVTAADYARAERLVSYLAQPLVDHAATQVTWLDPTHVVYVDHDARGDRLLQLDTATGKTAPLFKPARLATALNSLLKTGD